MLMDQGELVIRNSDGAVRRRSVNDCSEVQDKVRECGFDRVAENERYDLAINQNDTVHGINQIPLGEIASVPQDETRNEWDTVLVPVSVHTLSNPECFAELVDEPEENAIYPRRDLATQCREGWLYVFVDGYLWREIYVDAYGQMSDVNLSYRKGLHTQDSSLSDSVSRIPTGQKVNLLLLPYKIKGEEVEVSVAYSEIQWSWTQIAKMGGMNPDDPRLKRGQPLSPKQQCSDESFAAKLREQRLTKVTGLGTYHSGFDLTEGPIGSFDENDLGLKQYCGKGIAKLYLPDPVGVARRLAVKHELTRMAIQDLLEELQGEHIRDQKQKIHQKATFELAQLVHTTFFTQIDKIKNNPNSDDKAKEFAENVDEWIASGFNKEAFFKAIKQNEFINLADEVAEIKAKLIAWMRDTTSPNNFTYCLYDYFWLEAPEYFKGYQTLAEMTKFLKDHPASQIHSLITEKELLEAWQDIDEGQSFLMELLGVHPENPPHPLAEVLFASTGNEPDSLIDHQALTPEEREQKEKETLKPIFDIEKAQALDGLALAPAGFQIARRFTEAANFFLINVLKLPDVALNEAQNLMQDNQTQQKSIAQQKKAAENSRKAAEGQIKELQKRRSQFWQPRLKQLDDQIKKEEAILAELLDENKQAMRIDYYRRHIARLRKIKVNVAKRDAVLEKRIQEAKKALNRANKRLENFIQKNGQWEKIVHPSFWQAKSSYLAPVSRTLHAVGKMFESDPLGYGRLSEIELTVDDYLKGNYPKGFIPLDSEARQARSLKKRQLLNQIIGKNQTNQKGSIYFPGSQKPLVSSMADALRLRESTLLTQQFVEEMEAEERYARNETIKVLALKLDDAERELQKTLDAPENQQQKVSALKSERAQTQNTLAWADQVEGQHQKQVIRLKNQEDLLDSKLKELKAEEQRMQNSVMLATESKKGMRAVAGTIASVNAVILFEVWNLWSALNVEEGSNKDMRIRLEKVSALLDLGAEIISAVEAINKLLTSSISYSHSSTTTKVLADFTRSSVVKETARTFVRRFSNSLGGRLGLGLFRYGAPILSAGLAGYDAMICWRRGDYDAMAGQIMMAGGFTTLAVYVFIGGVEGGLVGLIGACLVLVGLAVYYWFTDKPLEAWLKACPWGTKPYEGGVDHWLSTNRTLSWKERPDYAMHDLYNLLYTPQVNHRIKRQSAVVNGIGGGIWYTPESVTIDVAFPAHNAKESDIDLKISFKSDKHEDWQRIDREKCDAFSTEFWRYASLVYNKYFTGWQLNIPKEFLKLYNFTGSIKIEASHYPAGKGNNVVEGLANEYVLPISQRDETGELEEPITKVVEVIRWGKEFIPNMMTPKY